MTPDWMDSEGMYVPSTPIDPMAGPGYVSDDREERSDAATVHREADAHRRWMRQMRRLADRGLLHTVDAVERESYETNLRIQAERWST